MFKRHLFCSIKAGSIEKASRLIKSAASQGAQLVLLPEAFIPAYPRGFSFGMVAGSRSADGRALWQRYWNNSMAIPSPEVEQLATVMKEAGVYVAIGYVPTRKRL